MGHRNWCQLCTLMVLGLKVDKNALLGVEYRKDLICVSSKTRSHDIMVASREAKMGGSACKGDGYGRGGSMANFPVYRL